MSFTVKAPVIVKSEIVVLAKFDSSVTSRVPVTSKSPAKFKPPPDVKSVKSLPIFTIRFSCKLTASPKKDSPPTLKVEDIIALPSTAKVSPGVVVPTPTLPLLSIVKISSPVPYLI